MILYLKDWLIISTDKTEVFENGLGKSTLDLAKVQMDLAKTV